VWHFTGLGWAGQAGRPVTEAPAGEQPVAFLSGACLAIPSESWRELGGFPAQYFMYCEDVDLSLRIRARGGELAVVPAARAVHDYDFDKGDFKWRMLERNRWATIVRNYPAPLLTLLAPALLATELAIWAAAVQGGWWRMKALATADLVRSFPRLLSERRALRRDRTVDAAVFAQGLTAELDSPFLGATAANPAVRAVLRTYWATVRSLLSVFRSRSA